MVSPHGLRTSTRVREPKQKLAEYVQQPDFKPVTLGFKTNDAVGASVVGLLRHQSKVRCIDYYVFRLIAGADRHVSVAAGKRLAN